MKKILTPAVLLFAALAVNAQSEKKAPPPPPPKPVDEKVIYTVTEKPPVVINKKLLDDFYARNPSVDKITGTGNVITLKMKDGTTEKYNMNKKEDSKLFTEKYGESPIPPPPPPPKKLS